MAQKHVVASRFPFMVNGRQVGMITSIKFEKGPPMFAKCCWGGCIEVATQETLMGEQFCGMHWKEYYCGPAGVFSN